MEKLRVIGTGGTIAATATEKGDKPTIGVTTLLHKIPQIRERFDSDPIQLLQKDSTFINHKDWARIAREAYHASAQGNKVLITHGTDTLAYTSAALSFAIQNPQTSIVLTGSMRLPEEPETDALKNLTDSAIFLLEGAKGVYVVFNGKVMTASRITKVHSTDVNAFDTVDGKYVATVEENRVVYQNKLVESNAQTNLADTFDNRVCTLKVTPSLPKDVFDAILDKGFKAINIAAFGTGNIPYTSSKGDPEKVLGGLLRKAIQTARRVPVVVTSQAAHGGVDLRKYEVGRKIEIPPMISGEDMSQEAAHVKLMWCLGQGMNLDEIRRSFERSYAGEITVG